MNVLAVEFSSPQHSVAVVRGAGDSTEAYEAVESGGRATRPFGMAQAVLREAGLEREAIDCVAVGLGPGSYTGVRAAIAVAQGWQFAAKVLLRGIGTLEVLAEQARLEQLFGPVSFVIDAQRQEMYHARWEISQAAARELEPLKLVRLPELQQRFDSGEILAGPEVTRWFPTARTVIPRAAALGRVALRSRGSAAGESLEPVYLRPTAFESLLSVTISARLMKAAVLHGKEDVRIENVGEHALKPGQVRVRIEAALTCGTDLKVYKRVTTHA
jgi:tRNA threonylcarbamoyl adenosine modification protein YeaZ